MNNDDTTELAIALHTNPGAYALLLGSGVSRPAGILTGWEIALDLLAKVAALQGANEPLDLRAWYRQRFEEEPAYDKLLGRLAGESTERVGLLRRYFEPTAEERERGIKAPTPAHHAIAELVDMGLVRMILTTNFDRLLEAALEVRGIIPDVLSSDERIQSAVPYVHSKCVIVKVHGDYLDPRIKNTTEELAKYSVSLDRLLDRVLDDFGLVVAGWSATWDAALRSAMLRCPNRRFTMFWLQKDDLTEEAKALVAHRKAKVSPVTSADSAFQDLVEKAKSLRSLQRANPLSTAVAVTTVKRYLAEARHRIDLHDLFAEEIENVYRQLTSSRFEVQGYAEAVFLPRMKEYEAVAERLVLMSATLSFHDDNHGDLLTRVVERIGQPVRTNGLVFLLEMQHYPALLVVYAAGVTAVAARHFKNLAALLHEPIFRKYPRGKTIPAVAHLIPIQFFSNGQERLLPDGGRGQGRTPLSSYLFNHLRPLLHSYLPDDGKYEDAFDVFEFILALTVKDIVHEQGLAIGRYWWRYTDRFEGSLGGYPPDSILGEFMRFGLDGADIDQLLGAGFFGRKGVVREDPHSRCDKLVKSHHEQILPRAAQWSLGF